ncbi:formate--tetrahydrofolate ligase, partial [Roseomonas sp. DSM 102946]|nr:formate--tetrahydrofolate ligase [Roseomonas sp. DSM 102946]
AMAALLREAMFPNLVQTLEGSPALVHGGPFANIAHGCNSVAATRLGLRLADVVVTEAGFGADLGGEKFCDIKCRLAGLAPSACVVVATVRALKLHGGVARANLDREDAAAVRRGVVNLQRHVENMRLFGLPVVVALNEFTSDTEAEFAVVREAMAPLGAEVVLCTHWADGAAGAADLARAVTRLIEGGTARFAPIYPDAMPLEDKVRSIARKIYRASEVSFPPAVHARLKRFEEAGYGHFPVCIAKTQYSFSADPALLGAPTGHVLPVREVRLSAGAGFIVVICGEVMTMPGLPRSPAAERIHLDAEGRIEGLF